MTTNAARISPALVTPLEEFFLSKAKSSQDAYRRIWREWCNYMAACFSHETVESASQTCALGYATACLEKPGQRAFSNVPRPDKVAPITVKNKLLVLHSIYEFLRAEKLVNGKNPMRKALQSYMSARPGDKQPTPTIDDSRVRSLIEAESKYSKPGRRDATFYAVLFGCGLRPGEALSLTVGDLRRTPAGTWYITLWQSKRQRSSKNVAMADWVADHVWRLVTQRREEGARDSEFLFVEYTASGAVKSGHKICITTAERRFHRACKQQGLSEQYSLRCARATAITKLLSAGLSHREVQEFSRHASISMVEYYDKRRYEIDNAPGKAIAYSETTDKKTRR